MTAAGQKLWHLGNKGMFCDRIQTPSTTKAKKDLSEAIKTGCKPALASLITTWLQEIKNEKPDSQTTPLMSICLFAVLI